MAKYPIARLREVVRSRQVVCEFDMLDQVVCKGTPIRTAPETQDAFEQKDIDGLIIVDEFEYNPTAAKAAGLRS